MSQSDPYHRRLAISGVNSPYGFRTCELWSGDITTLPLPVDLLVVSAFRGDYAPTPTSVIGALHRCGVNVERLARSPAYDFRDTPLECWVSAPLSDPRMPADPAHVPDADASSVAAAVLPMAHAGGTSARFGRLLCVETGRASRADSLGRAFASLFGVHALLEQLLPLLGPEHAVRTIAMPALGAGDQGFDVDEVVEQIVTVARPALERARFLERLLFVAYDERTAVRFRTVLERKLGRVRVPLASERLRAARHDAAAKAAHLVASGRISPAGCVALDDLRRLLLWDEVGNFELSIAGRRVAELVVEAHLKARGSPKPKDELIARIEQLSEYHVADWVRSYLHTLRVFGNESAHSKHADKRTPAHIDERDVELWCLSLHRVLDFWGSLPGPR
jgi:hypothetical protein